MTNHLKLNSVLHGFRVLREAPLQELDAVLYEMEHEQTGLKLIWIHRAEENKTFGIAFETLPSDDTGVFHILEHSVLCGSDRYPVKEPFIELVKSSLNTFLNAMTFPDKTFYPISSPNDKDFVNLMRVYLDAVFHPAIYHKPEIFGQEGWHYAFDEEGNPVYKGVVFNEMKGAMANADELMDDAINRALLPDTPYSFNSGGDPSSIPDLTYEQFIDTHRRFYSPSNAYVILDGDLDIDSILGIIDGEFLKDFSRTERIAPPADQAPVDGGVQTVTYEVSENEDLERHTRLAWGKMIGHFDDREKLVAVHVLHDVIAGNNQSPLPKCILDRGLAEDVIVSIMDSISQPYAKLEVRNFDEKNLDEIKQLLRGEIARLVREGLDREQIEASLANTEFLMRERDYGSYPSGLILGMSVLDSWLYGGRPEANLEVGTLFDSLRTKMNEGYFEELLRELYLDNPHTCEVLLRPSRTAGVERREAEAARIRRETAAWSPEDRDRYVHFEESLSAWQNSEDTPEQLATLPHLELSDIQDMPEDYPIEVRDRDGITLLTHDINTNGILYVYAYFDIAGLTEEELAPAAFLADSLGKIGTENLSAEQLQSQTKRYNGSIEFNVDTFNHPNDLSNYTAKFIAAFSTLPANLDKSAKLMTDMLTATMFSDESTVHDILTQTRMKMMQQIVMSGHSVGARRLSAMLTPAGVIMECTSGFSYYQWLKEQDDHWDWGAFRGSLESVLDKITSAPLTLSVTGGSPEDNERVLAAFRDALPALGRNCIGENSELNNLIDGSSRENDNSASQKSPILPWGLHKEGIVIPADIAFAIRGGSMLDHGGRWSGEVSLAARIISYAYLWNVVRVQGGAYGTGMSAGSSGTLACYSYRDPNGAASLEKYLSGPSYLRKYLEPDPDLTGSIIGAVSDATRLLTPRMKGAAADNMYLSGWSYEQRCAERRRILNATPEKLLAHIDAIEETLKDSGISIVGGQNQIDACTCLDEVYTL